MLTSPNAVIVTAVTISFLLCLLFTAFVIIIVRMQRHYIRQQQAAYKSEMETLQQERTRIAADLHDELSSLLGLAYRQVEAVVDKRGDASVLLPQSKKNLRQLVGRLSEVIYDMDDKRLLSQGMELCIRLYLNQYRILKNLQIHFQYKITRPLSGHINTNIYRMLQELVHNTVKHTSSRVITVQLTQQTGMLYFYYADDGPGSNTEYTAEGVGIKSLRQRILLLGGSMELKQENGRKYYFQIPL